MAQTWLGRKTRLSCHNLFSFHPKLLFEILRDGDDHFTEIQELIFLRIKYLSDLTKLLDLDIQITFQKYCRLGHHKIIK